MARGRMEKLSQFKINVSDEFTTRHTKKLSAYFGLSPQKRGQIRVSENPGLTLLDILEEDKRIGVKKGIDELCKALEFCQFKNLIKFVTDEFAAFKEEKPRGLINPRQEPVDMGQLKNILRDQLSRQDCYEIAMYLGLPAKKIERIVNSSNFAEELMQRLHDRNIIHEENIDMLIFALNARGLERIVTMLLRMPQEKRHRHRPRGRADRSGSYRGKSEIAGTKTCRCGSDSFEVLLSTDEDDDKLLGLMCTYCSAEWVSEAKGPTATDPPVCHSLSLHHKKGKFTYRPPLEIEASSMREETVTSIDDLKPGDHVIMRWLIIHDHHAIVVSKIDNDTMELIHWGSSSLSEWWNASASIHREAVPFPGSVRRVIYEDEDPPKHVIARARRVLHDKTQTYNLTRYNCEALATFCKVGEGFTVQGETVTDILPALLSWEGDSE